MTVKMRNQNGDLVVLIYRDNGREVSMDLDARNITPADIQSILESCGIPVELKEDPATPGRVRDGNGNVYFRREDGFYSRGPQDPDGLLNPVSVVDGLKRGYMWPGFTPQEAQMVIERTWPEADPEDIATYIEGPDDARDYFSKFDNDFELGKDFEAFRQ
jgi:hypothetical protein